MEKGIEIGDFHLSRPVFIHESEQTWKKHQARLRSVASQSEALYERMMYERERESLRKLCLA